MFSIEQIIYIKMYLALNNLQRLICHKTKQTKPNQTETFIPFLTFRFSTRGERETFFTMPTVPSDSTTRGASRIPNWPDPTEAQKSTHFALVQISTNSFFSKITQNLQPIASGHDFIHIPSPISYPGFLLWHLWLSHPPRASMNTCAQCVPLTVH